MYFSVKVVLLTGTEKKPIVLCLDYVQTIMLIQSIVPCWDVFALLGNFFFFKGGISLIITFGLLVCKSKLLPNLFYEGSLRLALGAIIEFFLRLA